MERKTIYVLGWIMLLCIIVLIISHAIMGYDYLPLLLLLIPCAGFIAYLENME